MVRVLAFQSYGSSSLGMPEYGARSRAEALEPSSPRTVGLFADPSMLQSRSAEHVAVPQRVASPSISCTWVTGRCPVQRRICAVTPLVNFVVQPRGLHYTLGRFAIVHTLPSRLPYAGGRLRLEVAVKTLFVVDAFMFDEYTFF